MASNSNSGPTVNGNGSGPSHAHGYAPEAYPPGGEGSHANGVNGYAHPSYSTHNEDIVNHLYHAGFQTGHYADTILHVHQNTYGLHAIVLSRSPFLAHLMSTSSTPNGQRTIHVRLEDEPEVTVEGFAIALGYLYSSVSLGLIRPDNARGVLAAGCLLGGMDELCAYAYDACRRSITVESISHWLAFAESVAPHPHGGHSASPSVSSANGSLSTPSTPPPPTPASAPATVFGPYASRLREDVLHFLIVQLPQALGVAGGQTDEGGRATLLQIFARVPFDLFKLAVESPTFDIGSDQARFRFAKEAIEIRKAGLGRASGAEETVVLAFGGGHHGSSAVHVTRKLRKRPLWKVNA